MSAGAKPYYERDGVALYLGDCRELLQELDLRAVDAVCTDPPYASAAATATTGWSKGKSGGNWGDMSLVTLMMRATLDPMPTPHVAWWFCDQHAHAAVVPTMFRTYPTVQTVVWDRDVLGMGAGYRRQTEFVVHGRFQEGPAFTSNAERDLIRLRPTTRVTKHSAEKPVGLMVRLLEPVSWSTVIDPYAGTGTTLLAARVLGRRAIGIEIEERWCEEAARRLDGAQPLGRLGQLTLPAQDDAAAERGQR